MNSIMLAVKIDRGDLTDLYEQVAAEIRRSIAEGEAKPGERLPPANDLAAVLGVNTTQCCGHYESFARKDCSSSAVAAASQSPERPSVAQS